ncbi:MAG: hypothetical protein H6Q32_980 [Bacteroidetes bacterium]|nr:hypothetical protein [Bacteroidota bacterium]
MHKLRGSEIASRLLRRPLLVVVVLSAGFLFLGAQTQQPKRKTSGKTSSVQAAAVRADSIRKARIADSLRAVERAAIVADSLRVADSVAQRQAAQRASALRTIRNEAYGVGERLVFDVNYGFITAGEAVMAISRFDSIAGRKCFRVDFTVNSLPSFSWIYKVEDRYVTFIDVEAIAPWRFEQHIREGSYSRDFIADFDHRKLIAKTTEGEHPIPKYVHDILSAFYFARTVDYSGMKTGDTLLLHNFYKDKSYELVVKVLGRQELEVAAGTFRTIVVEPLVKEGGLFKSEGRIVIWLTDDERKLPIRVNTKVIIGSIDTELREYSGLAGPLGSRVR